MVNQNRQWCPHGGGQLDLDLQSGYIDFGE